MERDQNKLSLNGILIDAQEPAVQLEFTFWSRR